MKPRSSTNRDLEQVGMQPENKRLAIWRRIALNLADHHEVRATGRFLGDVASLIGENAFKAGFDAGRASADPNATPGDVRLTIALHPKAFEALQTLHRTGIYGVTIANAAEGLVLRAMQSASVFLTSPARTHRAPPSRGSHGR